LFGHESLLHNVCSNSIGIPIVENSQTHAPFSIAYDDKNVDRYFLSILDAKKSQKAHNFFLSQGMPLARRGDEGEVTLWVKLAGE
jgi:hypothetical protein